MYLVNIAWIFKQYKDNEFLKDIIMTMKDKWISYFSDIPSIYLLASALNPIVIIIGTQQLLDGYYSFLDMSHVSVLAITATLDEHMR